MPGQNMLASELKIGQCSHPVARLGHASSVKEPLMFLLSNA